MPKIVVKTFKQATEKEAEYITKGYRDVGLRLRPDGKYEVYASHTFGLFGA